MSGVGFTARDVFERRYKHAEEKKTGGLGHEPRRGKWLKRNNKIVSDDDPAEVASARFGRAHPQAGRSSSGNKIFAWKTMLRGLLVWHMSTIIRRMSCPAAWSSVPLPRRV